MSKALTYVTTHAKAFTALVLAGVTAATYLYGPTNKWVLLAGTVLTAFGVGAVPNAKAAPKP